MASPQKENGFTPIAHELLEAFYHHKFTEYQRCIILHIWRQTYGYSKPEDKISNSQFVEVTGIRKGHVSRTLKELKELNIVTCRGNKLSVNKNWEKWKVTCRGNKSYLYRLQKLPVQEVQKKKEKRNIHDFSKKNREPKKMDYELITDDDVTPIGEVKRRNAKSDGYRGYLTNPILQWAEERMGHKFTNPLKQKKAISKMLYAGYKPDQITQCWEELEDDEFWNDKGIDFMTVLNQISKLKVKKESLEEKLWRN